MPIKSDIDMITAVQQNIFFLLNTSGRMYGELIEEVNSAMHEVIPELRIIANDCLDISFLLCRMYIDSNPEWGLCENIQDYLWFDARPTVGTALGQAYKLLNLALSRRNGGFLQVGPSYAPIIILVLGATPHDDVENGLEILKKNKWFQHSIKIGIEVDPMDSPNSYYHKYLLDFTMDEDAVIFIETSDLKEVLVEIIKTSMIMAGSASKGSDIIKYIGNKKIKTDNGHINSDAVDDLLDDFDF